MPFDSDGDPGGVKHLLAGVTFPGRSGPLERGDVTIYDHFGQNLGIAYSGEGAFAGVEVTSFVYPAFSMVPDPLQQAVNDVHDCHRAALVTRHGMAAISGAEWSWVEFDLAGTDHENGSVPSWLLLIKHDGWVVKHRCTSRDGATPAAVLEEVDAHVDRVGLPDTSSRVTAGHHQALTGSRVALRALEQWEPPQAAETRDLLRKAREHSRFGQLDEAIDAVQRALAAAGPAAGLYAELGRLHLLSDDLLAAAEACMAEEEMATGEAQTLEKALRAFMPEGITFQRGWGASLDSHVSILGTRSSSAFVRAVHKYLEFALGNRGSDWKLATASLASVEGMVFDAMKIVDRSGQSATVLVLNPYAPDYLTKWSSESVIGTLVTGNSVRGEAPLLMEDGQPGPSTQMTFHPALNESPPEIAQFVLRHLTTHLSQTMLLAGDEIV